MKIPLSSPFVEEEDIQAVVDVLRTPNLSLGPKLKEFEEKFANYIGTKYAIALNSGTSALHLAIKSLNIQSGDEVIVSPFTFVASANCILFENATPVFVDIEENTFNIDTDKIEQAITNKTKAIIDVDIFGRPSNKEKIKSLAEKYNLKVIEDSAEAIGAKYNGKNVGTFFDAGIFAFYPNKQMTTGEGGMLVTNNENIYKLVRSYRNQGRDTEKWLEHERIGYNYRLSDINCALGISQLNKINKILEKREQVANEYNLQLKDTTEITLPFTSTDTNKVSWFVYVIQVQNRNQIMEKLKQKGIACAAYFNPLHLTKFYKNKFNFKEGDFPICEKIARTTLALPFHTNLSKDDITYVCNSIKEVIRE